MRTKLQKWGNSYGIRLPMNIVKNQCLEDGSFFDITLKNKQIVLVISKSQKKENIESLISRITADNRHLETDWGEIKGQELW